VTQLLPLSTKNIINNERNYKDMKKKILTRSGRNSAICKCYRIPTPTTTEPTDHHRQNTDHHIHRQYRHRIYHAIYSTGRVTVTAGTKQHCAMRVAYFSNCLSPTLQQKIVQST
jgi:hypothetical protein